MRAIVFDLDGTLLNTVADIGNSCNAVLQEKGFPTHEIESYKKMVGNGFDILMRRALPRDKSITDAMHGNLVAAAREYYAAHMMDKTSPYENMPQILQTLADAKIALAVLSNKPDNLSRILIKRYFPDIPFAAIQGALPDIPLKPDPAALRGLMARHGWQEQSTAYVGDSNVDMETARRAGVNAWGAAWGFRGPKELEDAGAGIVLNDPGELPAAAGL